jgi:enhancing lycopene biosynthesis protein 2
MSIKGRVAIILSGLGYKTGSEIHETVLSYLALTEKGYSYQNFARSSELEISAPLARDDILNIEDLNAKDFDVLWFPGGAGAIKNLSTFSKNQVEFEIDKEVKRVISDFHQLKKPIVSICISPVILAKFFEGKRVEMTLGSDKGNKKILEDLGQIALLKKANEFCFDKNYNVFTTPAYMEKTNVGEIYHGILKIVENLERET